MQYKRQTHLFTWFLFIVDGLIDCLDPDCCGTDHCEKLIRLRGNQQQVVEDARQSCAHSSEISSLILSTKLAPPGSSFYDQLEFLLLRDLTTDKVDPRWVRDMAHLLEIFVFCWLIDSRIKEFMPCFSWKGADLKSLFCDRTFLRLWFIKICFLIL